MKPNIGGSGAGIQRFDALDELQRAVAGGTVALGMDDTALVQEFLPAEGGHITRLEILQHELLYAIRITPPKDHGFNLCPADICRVDEIGGSGAGEVVAVGIRTANCLRSLSVKPAMQIEATTAPAGVAAQALAISRAAGLDVCGIEFLVDRRDGRPYFYDVNALSNFVTDAPRVVGFDPFERLVDVIEVKVAGAGPGPRTLGPRADREVESVFGPCV